MALVLRMGLSTQVSRDALRAVGVPVNPGREPAADIPAAGDPGEIVELVQKITARQALQHPQSERRAADQFFRQVLRKKDMTFLISFGAEAELLQDNTNSPTLLLDGLKQLRLNVPVGGIHPGPVPSSRGVAGTILYDAVYLAANEKLKGEVGRKAVVLITDGVDTGSRMDEVIFEEFKGTGNSEIILDRKVADKRVFPSIDILRSGTRKEELLVKADLLKKTYVLRRILNPMGTVDAIEFLLDKLRQTKTNGDFFDSMNA